MATRPRQIRPPSARRASWERKRESQHRVSGGKLQRRNLRIKIRDCYTCQNELCGAIDPAVQVDHIVAVALGGDDSDENLQCLCQECNQLKAVVESRGIVPPYPTHLDKAIVRDLITGVPV